MGSRGESRLVQTANVGANNLLVLNLLNLILSYIELESMTHPLTRLVLTSSRAQPLLTRGLLTL